MCIKFLVEIKDDDKGAEEGKQEREGERWERITFQNFWNLGYYF